MASGRTKGRALVIVQPAGRAQISRVPADDSRLPLGMRLRAVCLLLVGCACESGLARSAKLTLSAERTSPFSAQAPGAVVSDLGGQVWPYVVLCGQQPKQPVFLSQDLGFGCLDSLAGKTETVRVWLAPLPATWDAGAACATVGNREFYGALSLGPADGGLAPDPDPAWPQASASGTWRRDGSPCGGVLNVQLAL